MNPPHPACFRGQGDSYYKTGSFTKMRYFLIITTIFLLSPIGGFAQTDSVFYDPMVDSLIQQVNPANIAVTVTDLANANGHQSRVTYTPGNLWSADYIKQQFDNFPGLTSVEFDTFYILNAPSPWNSYPLVNVVATLEGSGQSTSYYIVGGHFDTSASLDPTINWQNDWATAIAPGADDNATGVAAVLEIARILSDPANQFQPDITLKFVAFGAEERSPAAFDQNHRGSHHLASTASSNGDQIEGVYNVDMIGYNTTGNHYYSIVSNTNSLELGDDLVQADQLYQIGINSNSNPFAYATYSDHERFWAYGYKSVLLIENAPPWNNNLPWYTSNPYYHKAQDTPDKVNLGQVAKITKATLAAVVCRSMGVTPIVSDDSPESVPHFFDLQPNYPNPFNAGTVFQYVLYTRGIIKAEIFNNRGQRVSVLLNKEQNAGEHRIPWQAVDEYGRNLPSGIYLARFQFNGTVETQKVMLIK